MKRRFSKILGVGLTLALLASLLLVAAPVSADVSKLAADTSPDEISVEGKYTISFTPTKELEAGESITVRFPEDTDLDGVYDTHLESTGTVGSSGEDRIVIPMASGTTLSEITSISWKEYLVAGYPPHVDIKIDIDGDGTADDALVIEYAYNPMSHYTEGSPTYGALTGAWYSTFNDDGGPAVIDNASYAWLTTQASGPPGGSFGTAGHYGISLGSWKTGQTTPAGYIDGTTDVTALEIEVDSWIVLTEADVKEIKINNVAWGQVTIAATSGIGSDAFSGVVPASVTVDTDDLTVKMVLPGNNLMNNQNKIGNMASVQIVIEGVINPTEPGAYTLDVKTSEETAYVESESYDIDAPTVGGFVYVYNPSHVLMATFGGSSALNAASGYYDDEDFTIAVGPGTYVLTNNINISGKNVTLESSDGAEDTIIDAKTGTSYYTISIITNKGITIDGFTIDDADEAIIIDAEDATVTNCVITDATVAGIQIEDGALDATVSDNVIEDCATGILFEAITVKDMDDVDITGNEITEANADGAIVFGGGNENIDVTGNTITGNETSGIYFDGGGDACVNIAIKGNTISLNEENGIEIAAASNPPTKLVITENDILDNEDDGVLTKIWDAANSYIMFNNIYGNGDSVDNDAAVDINARFNWWGTTDDDDFDEQGLVDVEPWLMSTWETAVSGSKVATGAISLDAKTAADVKVSGVEDDTLKADIISAAKYAANPEGELDDAIAFYDVFVALPTTFNTTDVNAKLKFYDSAITTGSTAHFWTGDFWAECSDQEARDGIIYVTVSDDTLPALDELEETIFGVVAGEVVTEFGVPELFAPKAGAADVSLTPTFSWGAVAGAIGYDFEFADNANFVVPMVKLDGDLGRLIVTAYAYRTELPYSIAYYWRVRAVSATDESDWASGVFITMDEPEEPTPPVVIEPTPPAPPAPIITIEQPDIVVPLPSVTEITPAWIYVIIGVGAVLVIALIVLVVRTRRVA